MSFLYVDDWSESRHKAKRMVLLR